MQNVFDIQSAAPAEIDARIAELSQREAELQAQIDRIRAARKPLDEEFERRGGWSRAYFVNNVDGHLHSSTHCSSLRWTTSITWLTEHSGKSQDEIIEIAGWRACTICFADAPLGFENMPSQIKSDDDIAREARREERGRKAAEKVEKIVRDADGKVMFNTERSAEIALVEHLSDVHRLVVMEAQDEAHRVHLDNLARDHARKAAAIVRALADKRGDNEGILIEAMIAKADAKVIREAKEWNKNPLSNQAGMSKAIVPAKGEAAKVIRRWL